MESATSPLTVVRDSQGCIPLSRVISEGDSVVLLTPVVVPPRDRGPPPPGPVSQDPFEAFARALIRQSPKPRLHHVPYTAQGGVGQTHFEIISRENPRLLIFFISGPPLSNQPSQVGMAKKLRDGASGRLLVVLACCSINELDGLEVSFPTIIQTSGYSPAALEAAVGSLYKPSSNLLQNLVLAPQEWAVEDFSLQRDMEDVHGLWCQSAPKDFADLPRYQLQALLVRDGYAKHYVAREPESGRLVGFCATYTTYADSNGDRLVGSLAAVTVRPEYRRRGIGLSLHDYALHQLRRIRGVFRLQLGTTFPRLLFGLPLASPSEGWFRRRGWELSLPHVPGRGQEVCDWLLRFADYPERFSVPSSSTLSSAGSAKALAFRPCEPHEFEQVLELVDTESARNDNMGWCDQYRPLMDTFCMRDVMVGVAGGGVFACALTYVPRSENPASRDLPWAGSIGNDIGGATCICISDGSLATTTSRDFVMVRLLEACVRSLQEQGMQGMFLDAIRGGDEGFLVMGFRKWARYHDSWRPLTSS
ncbi:hypothetical protein RB595_001508 [Gaeumannomyces hyphopodioides]